MQDASKKDTCKLIYFNATSVKNKLCELEILRDSGDFDIICITETWCNESISNAMLCGRDFYSVRKDRSDRIGGGVCILIRKNLKYSNIDLPEKNVSTECVGISLFFQNRTIRLFCAYNPPNAVREYSQLLFDLLASNCTSDDSVVVVGDFNLPKIDWPNLLFPNSSPYDLCQELIMQNDLRQLVMESTHGENIIDLVLCTDPSMIDNLSVSAGFSTSLHGSIEFAMLGARSRKARKVTKDFRNADYEAISNYLGNISWNDEFNVCVSVQDFWNIFVNHIQFAIEHFVPSRRVKTCSCFVQSSNKIDTILLRK